MIPRERKWLIEKVILPILLALFGLIVAIVTIIPTFAGKKNDSANSSTFHMQINNSNKYEQSSLSTSFASPPPIEALNERIQSFAKAFPSAGLGLHPLGTEIRGYTIDF